MTSTNETRVEGTSTGRSAGEEAVVVVGVDGSEGSSAALLWAAEEARRRDATLRVVHAWHLPTTGYGSVGYVPTLTFEGMANEASAALRSQIVDVLGEHPAVRLEQQVVEGPAATVILDASRGAGMVVVGSRGRGGFSGLLLGSVSTHVAHHAHCPVVIVRS